jgi:hypothetical protein
MTKENNIILPISVYEQWQFFAQSSSQSQLLSEELLRKKLLVEELFGEEMSTERTYKTHVL